MERELCVFLEALGLSACTDPYSPGQRAVGGGVIGAGAGAAVGGLVGAGLRQAPWLAAALAQPAAR